MGKKYLLCKHEHLSVDSQQLYKNLSMAAGTWNLRAGWGEGSRNRPNFGLLICCVGLLSEIPYFSPISFSFTSAVYGILFLFFKQAKKVDLRECY